MSAYRYREIERILRKEILQSKYAEGSFPSVAALMRRFDVSRATVVRVMDELKRRGLIRSEQGRGSFILRKGAPHKIAVLFPETGSSEYYSKIVKTISIKAQKRGYALLFAEIETSDPKTQVFEAERLARSICESGVDGVIFQPVAHVKTMEDVNRRILSVFKTADIPVVLCDCDYLLDLAARSGYDIVGVNNVVAGAKLYRHLYESGARRIHYLTIADSARSHQDRLRGLALEHEALTGKKWSESNVLIAHPSDEAALRRHLRRERPDAFVCGNDITAAWLMQTLGRLGVKVPDDLLITGFNDVSISWLSSPAITTVRQPTDILGSAALQRLFERIASPALPTAEILIDAPLVVRDSTLRKTKAICKTKRKEKSP